MTWKGSLSGIQDVDGEALLMVDRGSKLKARSQQREKDCLLLFKARKGTQARMGEDRLKNHQSNLMECDSMLISPPL